jgi:translation initiation factor IF-2
MNDANDNENDRPDGSAGQSNGQPGARAPLTLKPRAGAVSAGTVKQSFSHGRSKTVVVETKRRRVDGAPSGPAPAPVQAERRPAPEAARPQEPRPPRPQQPLQTNLNLSPEEMRARQRVVEAARAEQERQVAERKALDDARRAEEEATR